MRAATLIELGSELQVQDVPSKTPGPGEVILEVIAAPVASYTARVLDGSRKYQFETPFVPGPGGIGRVYQTGQGSTRMKIGDLVYIDSTIRSRDGKVEGDSILLGWTFRTANALPLYRHYHQGTFAEQVLVPMDNVTVLSNDVKDSDQAARWSVLSQYLVPYGGLRAGSLKAGETIVISGATGGFGGAAVAVALAMGAARVVAIGRNERTLQNLQTRFGSRVHTVKWTGIEADDLKSILKAADGPVDMVLDFLPREASAVQFRAAALSVRHAGRVILMGGLRGEQGNTGLNYSWLLHKEVTLKGVWMYPPEAIPELISMIRAGLITLEDTDFTEFSLDQVNDAVAHAASHAGPNQLTLIRPDKRFT